MKKLLSKKFLCVSGALFIVASSFVLGFLTHRQEWISKDIKVWVRENVFGLEELPDRPGGFWRSQESLREDTLDVETLETLAALGYLAAVNEADAQVEVGVTNHQSDFAQPGLNVYTSAHDTEAFLMDMQGNILHTWRYPLPEEFKSLPGADNPIAVSCWRRVHLFENGDLLAIFGGIGMIKIDKDSKLIWTNTRAAHHDVYVHSNGNIDVLTRRLRSLPHLLKDVPVVDDYVTTLDWNGFYINEISILECLENSEYASVLYWNENQEDLLHTNTITFLDETHVQYFPFSKAGNILVSIRNLSMLAIIDPDERKIIWAATGKWAQQHEPILLENGSMLLFDNLGRHGRSRVIEFNPFTLEITWEYDGDLFTQVMGSVQRLANGNTLITETDAGRVLEVTPDKQVVWEFNTPYRRGENNDLVAVIPEMIRLPVDFPTDWAAGETP